MGRCVLYVDTDDHGRCASERMERLECDLILAPAARAAVHCISQGAGKIDVGLDESACCARCAAPGRVERGPARE